MPLDILLMEDDPAKKVRLLALLNSDKNLFGKVDTAICTAEAINKMEAKQYDLLIADVVVPSELGGEKHEQNCMDLFDRIDDGINGIHRPLYALPISASKELSVAAHEYFKGRPWGILPYTENNDECLKGLEKTARWILSDKVNHAEDYKCDVFIITALISPEFTAIEKLDLQWGALEPLDGSHLIRYGKFTSNGKNYTIGAAFCSRMGPVAASVLTAKAMLRLRPKLVLMSGICAGIPKKTEIGDVVAADISWDWQSGKYTDKSGNEHFEIAPHQIGIDDKSRNRLLMLKRDSDFWKSLAADAIEVKCKVPKLVIAPMATGSSVLADIRVTERIKANQHKNVSGLDMETYGVYAAVESCDPSVKVISMKSVCDQGDKRKNDRYQEYAANISAAAVHQFLLKHVGDII